MRINKFIAQATGMSRRKADEVISDGRVLLNGQPATAGSIVGPNDTVQLDSTTLAHETTHTTLILNKPIGYVCSRDGQGSKTIYDLLPEQYHHLKPVGRLDKDSSGLLLITDDGELAHQLTHPSFQKTKVYEITLDAALLAHHETMISSEGVQLEDGPSKLTLTALSDDRKHWRVSMHEGRNRQIRRTFAGLGYRVTNLNRIQFGDYTLNAVRLGSFKEV